MLKPVRMKKLRAIIPTEKRDRVVRSIHENGNVQLKSIDEETIAELGLEEETSPPILGEISSLTMEINRVLDIFDRPPSPARSSMEQFKTVWNNFFKPDEREKEEIEISDREEALKLGRRINEQVGTKARDLDEKLEVTENEIESTKEKIQGLKIIEKADLKNLEDLESSEFVFATAGTIPSANLAELENELREKIGEAYFLNTNSISEEKELLCIWTVAEDEDKALESLNFYGFSKLTLPELKGSPEKVREKLEENLQDRESKREEIFQKIRELSKEHRKELLVILEVLNIEKDRVDALNNFSKTQTATIIQAWVPENKTEEVEESIEEASDGVSHLVFSEPENPKEEPPTLLQNPPIISSFETLTKLFGTPGSGEIDPTPLLAFTYVLFFGIMLTDVAYGGILLIISLGLFMGKGRTSGTIRDFSIILILGSIATILTGMITGSYFGNFLTEYVLSESLARKIVLYNPIEKPMPLLLFSVLIGLVHEYIGVCIGLWEKIKQKEWKEAIGDRLSWLLLIPGGLLLVLHFFEWVTFDLPILAMSGVLIGSALVMVIYAEGPLGIMDVFDMLGNILSYTRILALALVTSALAITFNSISVMISHLPIIGVIIGALLFIGTQLFSLIINLISAFVHSLRLHYVEFFDKFFEGRGKSFKPFKAQRTHTEV